MTSPFTAPLTRPLTYSLSAPLGSTPGENNLGHIPLVFYQAPPGSSFGSNALYDALGDSVNDRVFRLAEGDNAIVEYSESNPAAEVQSGGLQALGMTLAPYSCSANADFSRLYVCIFGTPSCTASSTTDAITLNNHGYPEGWPIKFASGTMPSPLVAGTQYFAKNVTTNTFQVAATKGGAAIDLTTNGSSVKLSARGLLIADTSVPGTITPKGWLNDATLADTRDVAWIDSAHVAINDGTAGLCIGSLADETAPTILSAASLYSGAIGSLRGNDYLDSLKLLATASRNPTAVVIFDLGTVGAPAVKGTVNDAIAFKMLSEVIWKSDGTRIFTLSTGTRNNPGLGGDCAGVVDTTDPANPRLLDYIQDHIHLSGARRAIMSPSERYMFVANNSHDSIAVIDFLDDKPRVVAEILGSPRVPESQSPTGSQFGAAHGMGMIWPYIFSNGDFPAGGWRATFNVSEWY